MVSCTERKQFCQTGKRTGSLSAISLDELPLPVSFTLGDLKSYSKKEAVDHHMHVILYKHKRTSKHGLHHKYHPCTCTPEIELGRLPHHTCSL